MWRLPGRCEPGPEVASAVVAPQGSRWAVAAGRGCSCPGAFTSHGGYLMGGCPAWLEQRRSWPRRGLVRSGMWRPSVAAVGSPLGARGGHEVWAFALPRLGRGLNGPTGDDAAACTSGLLAPTKPSPRRGCTCLDRWAGRRYPTRTQDLTPKMALHPSTGAVWCAGLRCWPVPTHTPSICCWTV